MLWLVMNAEIKEWIQSSERFETSQQKETRMNNAVPDRTWQKWGLTRVPARTRTM